ncbi:DUF302 domain-containing protein [Danxiaibacter flavus]|uniref:DUF302 domain-containing protein n=1 Tax=Danxiaibacter flavus TaxID=3049108 RepID=A0ABV3ZK31_9BACT|nr:DUF302 domain-containing protein [Chitinophagaceae bacterium DXS]
MKKAITIEHIQTELTSNFDRFTFNLEKALGVLTPSALQALGASPASMASYLTNVSGENNLVLFNILLQGDLTDNQNKINIKQYQIGNPKLMLRIIANHAAAGLYLPVHLLVYEKYPGKAMIEYDLPSSLFAQFDNPEILSDSVALENKLIELIRIADADSEVECQTRL